MLLAVVRGFAPTRHENSYHTSPFLEKVFKDAHTPHSPHSSKSERRRDGVGPTACAVLLLEGGGGGLPVT